MAEAMLHSTEQIDERQSSLTSEEILNLFNDNEAETVTSIPFRPKGGSLYIFKTTNPNKRNDWKADGHS